MAVPHSFSLARLQESAVLSHRRSKQQVEARRTASWSGEAPFEEHNEYRLTSHAQVGSYDPLPNEKNEKLVAFSLDRIK